MPRTEGSDNQTDILSAARKRNMFRAGDRVLVAVSGGPDSVAMLHALHSHSKELGISLHVAHLNHQIRGEQSNLDEDFVRNLAQSLRLPVTVERVGVPALRVELRVGEEEAGRIARSKFLQENAAKLGANKIAVGHTADDRAESVLLNIIRGCGVDGLGSIRPVNGNIVRPLIDTSRTEVEAYIAEHALPYRVDESNTDTTYARNRVRHEVLPWLEREFNPEIKSALVRLAEIASSQSNLMESLAERARLEVEYRGALDAKLLAELPKALQYELLRSEIRRVKGDLLDITFEQTHGIIEALSDSGDFTITLPPGDTDAIRQGGSFEIRRRQPIEEIEPFDLALEAPGVTPIPSIGLAIECSIVENPTPHALPDDEAMIDADSVVGSLRVRSVRPGDRIVPLGMSGSKKLQDVFVDKKISRADRAKAAVVVDDEKILWVVGVVTSELGKVTDSTRKAISLSATRDR